MNVLFVASEAVPFKTGRLADVMGALPKALAKKGMDVRLVIPKYSRIAEEAKKQMKEVTTGIVNLAWRQLYYGVEEIKQDGISSTSSTTNGISSAMAFTATAMMTNASPISAAPS